MHVADRKLQRSQHLIFWY